jgi:bacillithiol biosynthesis cysteine-adding enzyme BshC
MTAVPFCRLHSLPKIFVSFCENFADVSAFYSADPSNAEGAVARRLKYLDGRVYDRDKVAAILFRHAERHRAPEAVRASIAKLREQGASAVIAGQQPGLFGGPLYSALKAIGVVKWAKRLEERFRGRAFVPMFWLSSEDHDWAEIDHASLLDAANQPREWRFRPEGAYERTPAYLPKIGDGFSSFISDVCASLLKNDFVADSKALIERCYEPDATFATAFGRLMTEWFGSRGLVVFDSSDAEAKRLGASIFEAELSQSATSDVIAATARLEHAGFKPQLAEAVGEFNLFLIDGGKRDKIVAGGGGFALKSSGRKIPQAEMTTLLAERPESFSPNVVLRPLYQDTLFPVALFLGGPHEIAYFAQVAAAYSHHGMEAPVITPRPSATLLDGRSAKLADELGVDVSSVIVDGADSLTAAALSRLLPAHLEAKYAEFARSNLDSLSSLKRDVVAVDPTLASPMESLEAALLGHVKAIEKKVMQAYRRKNQQIVGKVSHLRSFLIPSGALQERTLSLLSFTARFGPDVVDKLTARLKPDALAHQVISLGEAE